ncbi:MAG: DUF7453 family protein [Methylobacter sp.]
MLVEISRKCDSSILNATLPRKEMHAHLRSRALTSAMALGLTLGIPGQVWAAPIGVSFTRIAKTITETEFMADTTICASATNCFQTFGSPVGPAISDDEVAFYATTHPSGMRISGIYTNLNGSITGIEEGACPTRTCSGVHSETSLSDGTVAFRYFNNILGFGSGVLVNESLRVGSNGVLNTAFSYSCNTAVPIGNPAYCTTSIGNPSISKGFVAFNINSSVVGSSAGIYIYNNNVAGSSPVAVVTPGDSVPDSTGKFTSFGDPSLNGNWVAFAGTGSNSEKGIYTKGINTMDQLLSVVVDINTPIPGGTGNFANFGKPSLYGNKVAFRGSDSNDLPGIYTGGIGAALNLIADASTPIPGGTGTFTNFGDPSLSGNWVAFFGASSNGGGGIYVDQEDVKHNPLQKVIDTSDVLDDKTITGLSFGKEGLSRNQLAFIASFSDGSSGIYKAEIATTKDQCKKGGHTRFSFKNQGQCIQFVDNQHHGDKHGQGDK